MITIDVGGTIFKTTVDTLKGCRTLFERILENDTIFVDRDTEVFGKMLKLLRGYSCPDLKFDNDVLAELIYWDHEMRKIELPDWLVSQPLTVHTLDPQQSEAFGTSHGLLTVGAVQRMIASNIITQPLKSFVVCKAVGATEGWIDSVWMLNSDIQLAGIRYQFDTFFNTRISQFGV